MSRKGALTTLGKNRPSGRGILGNKPDTRLGDAEAPTTLTEGLAGFPHYSP